MNKIFYGDNLFALKYHITNRSIRLIYIDPPFNTGSKQKSRIKKRDIVTSYVDDREDYITFLKRRLYMAKDKLTCDGSIFVHVDYREVHYVKIMMDHIFGRENFMNEIIWAYDYGARSKRKWPTKHDNILWYVMNTSDYIYNYDSMDRIPYMAPGLCGPDKAKLGKTPTDTWWITVCPTNGSERTGYPTQKPIKLLKRIISIHSNVGDTVLDFFAGSGTSGAAATELQRHSILVDNNKDAIDVMIDRLGGESINV